MDNDAQLVMRIPLEMHERLREHAEKLSKEFGLRVSIAAAARRFINEGLERAGLPEREDVTPLPKKATKRKAAKR
jgi:predicted DNA-binding protein